MVTSKPFPPASGGAGCLYLLGLSLVAAIGVVMGVIAGAAAATATTQVHVDSCTNAGRGQEAICAAHWRADGHTVAGNITSVSADGPGDTGGTDGPLRTVAASPAPGLSGRPKTTAGVRRGCRTGPRLSLAANR